MLNDLYNYAIKNNLASRMGFKPKNIKAYISLSADGKFIAIDPGPEEKINCPDIGSMANGTTKSNIIAEKAEIILQVNPQKVVSIKRKFYLDAFESGNSYEPMFGICLRALTDGTELAKIQEVFLSSKLKPQDVISFKVNGKAVEQSQNYYDWWDAFRKAIIPIKSSEKCLERCLITGDLTEPVATVPKISGLNSVGGHTSGDSLICFDKSAFCSYNLSQAQNAAVSEEAITAINSALNNLIPKASIYAGSKLVHWYKEPVGDNEDLLNSLDFGYETNGEEQQVSNGNLEETALTSAKNLIESVEKGENPQKLDNRYYIMAISGAGGRVMIRSYMQGSYEQLYNSFDSWFKDLSLTMFNGKGRLKPPKLSSLYFRLLKKEKINKNIGERMNKELSGLSTQILYAIINNTPLPDAVAVRAFNYIRSDMLTSDENSKKAKIPDGTACQLLKAWIVKYEVVRANCINNTGTPCFCFSIE